MNVDFNWLRHYPEETKNLDEIPLLGLEPFPWENLSKAMAQIFECPSFELIPAQVQWRVKEDLLTDISTPTSTLAFTIPTLEGKAYFLMAEEEVSLLINLLLTNDTHPLTIHDEDFKASFTKFVILETLYAMKRVAPQSLLMPVLSEKEPLHVEDSLCLDITIKLHQSILQGRLILSQKLRQSISHYLYINSSNGAKRATTIPVLAAIQAGSVALTFSEIKSLCVGDFICLDYCSIEPTSYHGEVTLEVFGQPAFRGEIEEGTIKIIKFPSLEEEKKFMSKNYNDKEEEEFEDFELEDEESEIDDFEFDDDEEDDENDEDDEDGQEQDDEENDDKELDLSQKNEEEQEKEEFDELNEDLFKELDENVERATESKQTPTSSDQQLLKENLLTEKEEKEGKDKPKTGLLKPTEVPVSLTVELGQLTISMEKLMQIEVGNLLDISLRPNNEVILTLNGKAIAKAELIRIGENLGVRILELG